MVLYVQTVILFLQVVRYGESSVIEVEQISVGEAVVKEGDGAGDAYGG